MIEEAGARVFVDSEVAPMLGSAELDAQTEGDQVTFGLTTISDDGAPNGNG